MKAYGMSFEPTVPGVFAALLAAFALLGAAIWASAGAAHDAPAFEAAESRPDHVRKPADVWRSELTPLEYWVLRERGTEDPHSGRLLANDAPGVYSCAGCALELFRSEAKFGSGTGWPSFSAPADFASVEIRADAARREVRCARCGSHLGHVFEDGPAPTGLRYCVNSVALRFAPAGVR